MKQLLISIFFGVVLTLTFYIIGILFGGSYIFILPFNILLFLIGISGIFIIPIGVFLLLKRKQKQYKPLTPFIGIAIGFYLGLIFKKPIEIWDNKQRNIGGMILTQELEDYYQKNGKYPIDLTHLNLNEINDNLPFAYQSDRFTYYYMEGGYELDIDSSFFAVWHWNSGKNEFEFIPF